MSITVGKALCFTANQVLYPHEVQGLENCSCVSYLFSQPDEMVGFGDTVLDGIIYIKKLSL